MFLNRKKMRVVSLILFLIVFLGYSIINPSAWSQNPLEILMVFVSSLVLFFVILPRSVMKDEKSASQLLESPLYIKWRTTAAEMGLKEEDAKWLLDKPSAQVMGSYRNHYIRIFQTDKGDQKQDYYAHDYYTNYDIELKNHVLIDLRLKPSAFLSLTPDITAGDPEFDNRFEVKGTSKSDIRAILDSSLRDKIMSLGNISLIKVSVNLAHYEFHHPVERIKTNAEQFKDIVNTLIDIVERIETYIPPV
jgi:hypothetical protein